MRTIFVKGWSDYELTSSYKNGARWNSAKIPVLYFSSNVQNAMLETSNYEPNPDKVNKFYSIAVFDCPELRLHTIDAEDLPSQWNCNTHIRELQLMGDDLLLSDKYDGIIVPSATINADIATHPINSVRQASYANVIINPQSVGLDKIRLVDAYQPVYSSRMFKP